MDDRTTLPESHAMPVATARAVLPADAPATATARALADPRTLTILTTEHWSLLSARALVYNEAFARGGMFLSFLSASLVALGLIATGTGFSTEFFAVAAIVLAIDLFLGVATLGRVATVSGDDIRCLQGMNRIRHAYHEIVPGLEPYFITAGYDDIASVLGMYGPATPRMGPAAIVHGLTTTPGMIGVIDAAIAGVLGGVLTILFAGPSTGAVVIALVVFAFAVVGQAALMIRGVRITAESMAPAFPRPSADG